jgi:hypothetical protein
VANVVPAVTIWEDAHELGYLARRRDPARGTVVSVTGSGADHLRAHRPDAAPHAEPPGSDTPLVSVHNEQREVT